MESLRARFILAKYKNSFDLTPGFFFFCLFLLAAVVIYFKLQHLHLDIALKGWSPIDYARHVVHPENYQLDWPYGAENAYHHSWPMRVFVWVYANFPEQILPFTYFYVATVQLLLACAIAYFAHTLFGSYLTALAIVALGLTSRLMGVNMANLGAGVGAFTSYLYYNVYHIFLLLALGTWLQKRYYAAAFCLLATVYTHFLIGTYAIAVITTMSLYKAYREKRFDYPLAAIVLLMVGYAIKFVSIWLELTSTTPGITNETWLLATRLFNYHYFGISMEHYSSSSATIGIPILWLMLFYPIIYFHYRKEQPILHDSIALGVIFAWLISIIGLLLSEYTLSKTIISANMQRASEISSIIAFSYIIAYLMRLVREASILGLLLGAATILYLFTHATGISFILTFISVIPILKTLTYRWLMFYLLIFCLVLVFANHFMPVHKYLWLNLPPKFDPSPYVIFFIIFALGLFSLRRTPVFFCCLGLLLISSLTYKYVDRYDDKRYAKANSKYLAQLWLRDATSEDSLIMLDPGQAAYGWREFSERSFFGNIVEWSHTSILYSSNPGISQEGAKRAALFGFDFSHYPIADATHYAVIKDGYKALTSASQYFYSLDEDELVKIINEYKISHLILDRNMLSTNWQNQSTVYENEHYLIYDLRHIKNDTLTKGRQG